MIAKLLDAVLIAPTLHLVFRTAEGAPTATTWYLFAVAAFMIVMGGWMLISPSSYARFWMRSPTGRSLLPPPPAVARAIGAIAILTALVATAWMAFLAEPGHLY